MEYQMLRGRQPKELLRIPSPSGDWECQMRDFVRPNHFDLVINMFTSFGYFEDQEENMKVLRNIKIEFEK